MRTGERSAMPGSRQVSCGSSASAVPMPTMIASFCARRRCTRSRAASPVIATGLPPAAPGLAVGRHRELERHARPAVAHAQDVAGVVAPRLVGADADIDRNALRAQPRMARARDFRIGILERRDDARNAGLDDGIGAGRRLALVRARLERDIQRVRPARASPARRNASTSACGRPPVWVQPRPTMTPSLTITAPTAGLGQVRPRPRRPSAKRQRHEARVSLRCHGQRTPSRPRRRAIHDHEFIRHRTLADSWFTAFRGA